MRLAIKRLLLQGKIKKMSKRSSKNKPKSFSEAIGIKDRFESDTVNFFIGLVMLAIAVYLVIAMVSYLTTDRKSVV